MASRVEGVSAQIPANYLQADINISTAGDNTIVADTAGSSVKVWGIWLVASGGANNIKFRNGVSGATDINAGTINLAANGSFNLGIIDVSPYFVTTIGKGFGINLSAATAVVGRLYYTFG